MLNKEIQSHFKDIIYFKTMHGLSNENCISFILKKKNNLVVPNQSFRVYLFQKKILQIKPRGQSTVLQNWLFKKYQILRFEIFLESIMGHSNFIKLEIMSARSIFFEYTRSLKLLVTSTFRRSYVQPAIVEFTKNFTHLL